ncbi:glycoside hydrolase family 97 protein [Saccharopolyspora sp. NPDC002578]
MSTNEIDRRTFGKAAGVAGFTALAWSPGTAAQAAGEPITTSSPDGSITAQFRLQEGTPQYRITRGTQVVLDWSGMGFELGDRRLGEAAELVGIAHDELDETWRPVWGSSAEIRSHCRSTVVRLHEQVDFDVEFRVFDDGVGFRYFFPQQPDLGDFEVLDEHTEFRFTADHTAWSTPANYDSVEYLYTETPLTGAGKLHPWQEPRDDAERLGDLATPLTLRVADDLYLAVHEAALLSYPDMTLTKIDGGPGLRSALVPRKGEGRRKALLRTPFPTPWRAFLIGREPGALVESNLVLNLNEPCAIEDTSWIAPGKFLGVWWEIHKGRNTWIEGPDLGASTENVLRAVDFAADNGIPYVLAEGWNKGWKTGGDFGDDQDFLTPNEQLDLRQVLDRCRERGVAFLAHNETGGGVDNYERQLDQAFALYAELGMPGVKTGYAGDIDAHHHHDQWMVEHYQRVIHKAARHRLLINAHEPIKGTGIERTYPNFVSREGARGIEYDAWSQGNPPEHTVTLPFTTMLAGPFDYTPGIFDITWFPPQSPQDDHGDSNDGTRVHTTRAHQLALYPVLLSGLQQLADVPEHYEGVPEFEFLRQVPVSWDETRVLHGEIGDFITMARRSGPAWFVGSLTDEQQRTLEIPLDFLGDGRYVAHFYRDAPGTDVETNPNEVEVDHRLVDASTVIRAELAGGGGHALHLAPAGQDDAHLPEYR